MFSVRSIIIKQVHKGSAQIFEDFIMYKHFVKRLLDIVISVIGIVILAVPMLIVAIIIKIDSPGPVFFKQRRIGLHKKEFILYKFRSMPTTAPKDVATHKFDVTAIHMSKFQKAIRKYSVDELPQLYNILGGSCSVIGPRPALWNQYDLIEEHDKYGANDVKPGLTGWAQINGRDELEIPVKAKFDGEYVRKQSFIFDCKCFFGTIMAVLKHDGVVEGGSSDIKDAESIEESSLRKK